MALSSTGFTRQRLADIKADYDQRFTDALGPVNTAPDAVVGQIIGIFAAALDDVNEALQDNYDAMYPASAEGTSLDGAVSYVGLERLGATATQVVAVAYGTESTLLPAGVLARSGNTSYATTSDAVITRANAIDVELAVTNVINATAYQIIAGGVLATYTSDASATGAEIAAGLAAAFDANKFTAVATGATLRVYAADKKTGFPLTVDANLSITKIGSPVTFTAVELGANVVPVGGLNVIDSPILGWDSLSNLAAGSTGRNVETDAELRTRHASSVRATGSATVKAIRARLLADVPEISAAYVYENRTNQTVDSMPPHSIECVVVGGADSAVGQTIWDVKPAGIETYGSVPVAVLDANGDTQTAKFSRPVNQFAWVRVSVNVLYPEESLSTTAKTAIAAAVLAYGSGLNVGDDIITQRFYGPIYGASAGIGQITVETAVTATAGGTPSYSTNNISIGRANIALFDSSRIVVVGL